MVEAAALLGGAKPSRITVSNALSAYWGFSADKTIGNSPDQIRRWENPRKKAAAGFIACVGDKAIEDVTTEDLIAFHGALTHLKGSRVERGRLAAGWRKLVLI